MKSSSSGRATPIPSPSQWTKPPTIPRSSCGAGAGSENTITSPYVTSEKALQIRHTRIRSPGRKRGLHRARRDEEGLDQEALDEDREQERRQHQRDQLTEVLAEGLRLATVAAGLPAAPARSPMGLSSAVSADVTSSSEGICGSDGAGPAASAGSRRSVTQASARSSASSADASASEADRDLGLLLRFGGLLVRGVALVGGLELGERLRLLQGLHRAFLGFGGAHRFLLGPQLLHRGELRLVDPALLDPRLLPAQIAQVVELRPADVPVLGDLELGDRRRVEGERALDTRRRRRSCER